MPDGLEEYLESLEPADDEAEWHDYLATVDGLERLEKGPARQKDWEKIHLVGGSDRRITTKDNLTI